MANKSKQLNKNNKQPVSTVEIGKPEPHQEDWAEMGEPVPTSTVQPSEPWVQEELPTTSSASYTEAEQNSWAEAVATQEEDAQWDGSNEPADVSTQNPSEPSSTDEAEWGKAPAQPAFPKGKQINLIIETHHGHFNSETPKLLIFGETGTHKTRFASTFPNVIFADVDHGMSSVTEKVERVYIHDDERGFEEMKALLKFLEAGEHAYETVVLDTLNELQRVIMRFTIDEYTHIRRSYGNLPGQSDYGKMLYEFMELVRGFIALPMKVVLLAQVNTQQFETDTLGPQLIGKNTARELARKMDVIGYIYKSEGEEGATVPEITFDAVNYVTKDRSNKLPASLPNPSYGRMAAYWK